MKTSVCLLLSIFLVVAGILFVSATCDSGGGESGTLTVGLTGIPAGSDGHLLFMGLYEGDADPFTSSLLAVGSIEIGTEISDVMADPTSSAVITFDPGDYDLYLWIDMNDNMETISEPEAGTDMTHTSFPFDVTIDGDTTVTVTSNAFELFSGF